jgi:hypothetical protein
MVRCRLDDNRNNSQLRYVAAVEFDLWRHLMESKHERSVAVEQTSVWVPETAGLWDEAMDTSALEPVVRMRFEKPGPQGTSVPVVRFFPTETYPEAKSALLAHFDVRCRWTVDVTPGYFIATAPPGAGDDVEDLEMSGTFTENPDREWALVS